MNGEDGIKKTVSHTELEEMASCDMGRALGEPAKLNKLSLEKTMFFFSSCHSRASRRQKVVAVVKMFGMLSQEVVISVR